MDKDIWLICDECARRFDVDLDMAREIWKDEEQGIPVTCGNCDAVQREESRKHVHKEACDLLRQPV